MKYKCGDTFKVPTPPGPSDIACTATIVSINKGRYHMKVVPDGSNCVTQMVYRTEAEMDAEGWVKK